MGGTLGRRRFLRLLAAIGGAAWLAPWRSGAQGVAGVAGTGGGAPGSGAEALAVEGASRDAALDPGTETRVVARPSDGRLDAIVIGGGLAGLVAVKRLRELGHERVVLLEARDRVGGRTLNQPVADGTAIAEAGGQWIGPTQDAMLALLEELGIGHYSTYRSGGHVDHTIGRIGLLAILDYTLTTSKLDRMARRVPLDEPWRAKDAAEWDAISVGQWMDESMWTDGGRELIELGVQTTLSASAYDVSLLYYLFHLHSCTDHEHVSNLAQSARIEGGAQTVSLALAERLGDAVRLGEPVESVTWDDDGVTVRTANDELAARQLVVAMMPRDVERITFDPPLPEARRALQRDWATGTGSKFHAVYDTPFWRADKLNGRAISESAFIALTFDNSPLDGSKGILVGFAADEDAIPADPAERRARVLESFTKFFGDAAGSPIDYAEKIWADDPLTAGCVSPLPPGFLTAHGPALRAKVGPIHWAGAETSPVWNGYMDGAVRSGQRVAQEVSAALL